MLDERPAVSVVIPARDAAEHLPDALGSLGRQGPGGSDLGDDLEVVVVDDGSVDDTDDVLAEAGAHLRRLSVVRHSVPRGVSAARNHGVRRSSGAWVTFLDPDDWFFPGHLAAMLRAAGRLAGPLPADGEDRADRANGEDGARGANGEDGAGGAGVDFLVCDQVQSRGTERTMVRAPEPRRHMPLDPRTGILPTSRTTMVNYVQVSSRFVSRAAVDAGLARFDESLPTAEDREWAWRLLLGARSYAVVDAPGYVYRRQVAGSLTDIGDARQLGFLDAYGAVLDGLRAAGRAELEPKALRDALVVLHHHVQRRATYPDDVWRAMVAGAGALLDRFDDDVVAAQVAALGPDRVHALRRQGVHL
ncbi:hypothetical protein GCM10009809_03240 [Isoptericola hypogeus]|uniref:Glycosyltransferase 2-like domain-containing protein n=1 Tax=Isoptericola hypogeus TaxID=300179 RepID=A0ABN2IRY1_9MICO